MAFGFDQAWLDARQKPQQPPKSARGATIGQPKVSKHRNRKTVLDGLTFDSAKEAKRWQELSLWQQVGAIRDLRRQVSFDLYAPNGERICQYRADFCYFSLESGKQVIEDVKSPWTRKFREYRIKAKWMAAQSNPISEV